MVGASPRPVLQGQQLLSDHHHVMPGVGAWLLLLFIFFALDSGYLQVVFIQAPE